MIEHYYQPPEIEEEKIVAAAVEWAGLIFSVPAPGRHHSVAHAMYGIGLESVPMTCQGFLTSKGRFVTRQEALTIAVAAGQLLRKTGPADTLFSEDVW